MEGKGDGEDIDSVYSSRTDRCLKKSEMREKVWPYINDKLPMGPNLALRHFPTCKFLLLLKIGAHNPMRIAISFNNARSIDGKMTQLMIK